MILIIGIVFAIALMFGMAGALVKFSKVSLYALVKQFGMNKFTLVFCAVVVGLFVLGGPLNGILGIVQGLLVIPCALLLWWFGIRKYKDNSDKVSDWYSKWNNFMKEEKQATKQHDREKMAELKSMFNDGYNNMSSSR